MNFCEVYIEHAFLNNETLTYATGGLPVVFGMRVLVEIKGREVIGFVVEVHDRQPLKFDVLPIKGLLDQESIINNELYELAQWMSYNTVSPMIQCLQTILPNQLRPTSSSKDAKLIRYVRKTGFFGKLTPKQKELVDQIEDSMTYSQARAIYSNVKKLVDTNVLEEFLMEAVHEPLVIDVSSFDLTLSDDQKAALESIELKKSHTYLLKGVTGSGKTEVYLQKAREVLAAGDQVLILVPEISLTPQMIERVSKRFGEDVAIYHSGLNQQEKYEQYKRVQKQEISIVVGTRSAIFLPFSKLGLIVMDEEHDASYKQTKVPYYHTRDIAIERCLNHGCPLVLGSASPALETYARALKGVYTLLELKTRINQNMPSVKLINTREVIKQGGNPTLTPQLLEAIKVRLDKGEQVMLLLNRRGYHTYIKDLKSEGVLQCPNCDVALNYHQYSRSLKCHICGFEEVWVPGNNHELMGMGVGTQKLVEMLESVFPGVSIGRMDHDTTRTKGAHARILKAFENKETQILVGTQMIAKGLDYENVTLVGVISADSSLIHADYRTVETSFNLLLQAAGRSGRGDKQGEVIIQAQDPNHYAIVYASHHQYENFFKQEMTYRKMGSYPPYTYLITVMFQGQDALKVEEACNSFKSIFNHQDIRVIGPSSVRKLNTLYKHRLILKGRNLRMMLEAIHGTLIVYRLSNRIGVSVDVNPLTID